MPKTVERNEAQEGVLSELQAGLRTIAMVIEDPPSPRNARMAHTTATAKHPELGISRYTACNVVQGTAQ